MDGKQKEISDLSGWRCGWRVMPKTAFRCLPDQHEQAIWKPKALKERFEPKCQHNHYQAEFKTRRKKKSEGWADYAEDLKVLVDGHAFPDLEDKAKEWLALNNYLWQIEHSQVAFAGVSVDGDEDTTITTVSPQDKLMNIMEMDRVDELEHGQVKWQSSRPGATTSLLQAPDPTVP